MFVLFVKVYIIVLYVYKTVARIRVVLYHGSRHQKRRPTLRDGSFLIDEANLY